MIDLQQRLNKSRQGGPTFHYSIIPWLINVNGHKKTHIPNEL